MELWIRSQDKENLIQPNYINIGGNKTDKYFIWGHNVLLGKYKSKKRALEVLDEIQEFLEHLDYGFEIYEMPKE